MSNTIYWHPRFAIQIALDDIGMSQKDLAHRLDWPPSKLSLILNGKQRLTVDDLMAIARIQGRDPAWYWHPPPPHPDRAAPLSLDLGPARSPRYVKLSHQALRPRDTRPPSDKAA